VQRQRRCARLVTAMNTEILRRIAERGLAHAQREQDSVYCDIFQHMLDEIERTSLDNSEVIAAFRKFASKVKESRWAFEKEPDVLSAIAIEIAEELEVERML